MRRGSLDKLLALDGGADGGKLFVGNRSRLLAIALKAVVHILIAAGKDFRNVIAIIPAKLFDGGAQMKHGLHRVTETSVSALTTDQAELHASAVPMVKVEAYAVTTAGGGQVKGLAIVLVATHLGAIMGSAAVTMEQGTHEIKVMIDNVVKLADGLGLDLFRCAKYGAGDIAVHTAIRTGGGDTERGEISVIHQLEICVVVADELAGHHLGDTFGGAMTAKRSVALKLEKVGGEVCENDFVEHFSQNGGIRNAIAFRLNLKTIAAQGLAIGTIKPFVQLDKAVGSEILVALESLECVAFAVVVSAVVALDIGDGGGLCGLSVFSHFVSPFLPFGSVW